MSSKRDEVKRKYAKGQCGRRRRLKTWRVWKKFCKRQALREFFSNDK